MPGDSERRARAASRAAVSSKTRHRDSADLAGHYAELAYHLRRGETPFAPSTTSNGRGARAA